MTSLATRLTRGLRKWRRHEMFRFGQKLQNRFPRLRGFIKRKRAAGDAGWIKPDIKPITQMEIKETKRTNESKETTNKTDVTVKTKPITMAKETGRCEFASSETSGFIQAQPLPHLGECMAIECVNYVLKQAGLRFLKGMLDDTLAYYRANNLLFTESDDDKKKITSKDFAWNDLSNDGHRAVDAFLRHAASMKRLEDVEPEDYEQLRWELQHLNGKTVNIAASVPVMREMSQSFLSFRGIP